MTQYAKRDIVELDRQGGYYSLHAAAMTGEGLHSKSDIAAELAWRDAEIDRLKECLRIERAWASNFVNNVRSNLEALAATLNR